MEVTSFKYAPLTFVDVERTFSKYKKLFFQTDKVYFLEIKKKLLVYINKNQN